MMVVATGMFSLLEAILQERLGGSDGFRELENVLIAKNETDLQKRFRVYRLAVNVLKHGRGRSYDSLVQIGDLPFRILMPGEFFFNEGDVSEVYSLIDIDEAFIRSCVNLIREVFAAVDELR